MDTSRNFYVGIENSKGFRRNVLESSKDVVSILKTFHKISNLRKQKQKNIDLLKENMKEITTLVKHLDSAMPDMGIRASKNKVDVPNQTSVPETSPSSSSYEIDMLENQLKDIDDKLNNL